MKPNLLELRDVSLAYQNTRSFWRAKSYEKRALNKVNFSLTHGECLGVVGESGSGKTSLARTILRLNRPSTGEIRVDGCDVWRMSRKQIIDFRRKVQMVFQDPRGSLNPRMTINELVSEPLDALYSGLSSSEIEGRVTDILERVGIPQFQGSRYPHQFSGGQCQRIGLARALVSRPSLLVCDEPLSSLDVSIQSQVIRLLIQLKADFGLSMLMISHNLGVLGYLCDRAIVLYKGQIVEVNRTEQLLKQPQHPYTQELMAAVPIPDPRKQRIRKAQSLRMETESEEAIPGGCCFKHRCPYVRQRCLQETPILSTGDCEAASVACHFQATDRFIQPAA